MALGDVDGDRDGLLVGYDEGEMLGEEDGLMVGDVLGDSDGEAEGEIDGDVVGRVVGLCDGLALGNVEGDAVGVRVSPSFKHAVASTFTSPFGHGSGMVAPMKALNWHL